MSTRRARLDSRASARYWVDRQIGWLERSIVDRAKIPAEQVIDVHFHEFMPNQMATVERVFAHAQHPMNDAARSDIEAFIAANPPGKYGVVDYRFAPLGLDPDVMREQMRFYQEHFDVPNA